MTTATKKNRITSEQASSCVDERGEGERGGREVEERGKEEERERGEGERGGREVEERGEGEREREER